jgi:deoxyhypusine synthase
MVPFVEKGGRNRIYRLSVGFERIRELEREPCYSLGIVEAEPPAKFLKSNTSAFHLAHSMSKRIVSLERTITESLKEARVGVFIDTVNDSVIACHILIHFTRKVAVTDFVHRPHYSDSQ